MITFWNLLACDFKRTLFSPRFLAAVFGYTLVTILTMFDELRYLRPGKNSVVYVYQIIRYLDFHIVYLIFAAIPGALLFCSDWDNRFIRFTVVRCTKIKYAISKLIACFISAVCVVFFSEALTLALFHIQFPLHQSYDTGLGVYSIFAATDQILLYFIARILCEAFCAGFLCVFALWLSTIIINAFVALAAPLLAYYLIITLSFALNIPGIFNIGALSNGYVSINDSPSLSFSFTVAVFLLSAALFGWLFVRNCTRRIEHG